MKKWLSAIAAAITLACASLTALTAPASAQWQVCDHCVPIGNGAGVTGFASAAPVANGVLWSSSASADPSFTTNPLVSSIQASKALTAKPSALGIFFPVNLNYISSDNVDAGTDFIIGNLNRYIFGGSSVMGGRIALDGRIANTAATNAANANRNYVGVNGVSYTAVGDGGTDTSTGAKGGFFAFGGQSFLDTGATNVFANTAAEFDTFTATGSSVRYNIGMSVVGGNAVRGSEVDAAITVGGQAAVSTFGPHIGWKHGILFTDINAGGSLNPFYADSVLIDSYWQGTTPTIAHGVRLTGFTITGNAFSSSNFSVSGAGVLTAASFTNNLSAFAATTSAQLAGVISNETGSGALVFGTSPTFTTQITAPKIIGGTAAGDSLTFQTTSGNGSGDTFVWLRGNNGATTAMTLSSTTLELGDAVNTLTLGDSAGQAIIKVDGASTNATLQLRPKGTGGVAAYNASAGPIATFSNNAGATANTNFIDFGNSSTGNAIIATVFNSFDTNVSTALRLQKGTGSLFVQTTAGGEVFTSTSTGAMSMPGAMSILNATAIAAGGTAGAGFKFSSTANFGMFFGSGAPTLSAAKGSIYLRSDGSSTSTRLYVNTDGGTTWTNVVTGSWLLQRDLDPAANDNTPAFMNQVA